MPAWLEPALGALRQGMVVAVPTESYFALAADATSPSAVAAVIALKERDLAKGIGLLASRARWRELVKMVSPLTERIADHFWPGALSLVLPAEDTVDPRLVVDGHVSLRVPGDSSALELVEAWGGPLTATSANLAGQTPCRTASEVIEAFGVHERLYVIDGQCPGGPVSTLLRLDLPKAKVLRAGAVSLEALTRFLPNAIE